MSTMSVCGHCGKKFNDPNEVDGHECPDYVKFFVPRFNHIIERLNKIEKEVKDGKNENTFGDIRDV